MRGRHWRSTYRSSTGYLTWMWSLLPPQLSNVDKRDRDEMPLGSIPRRWKAHHLSRKIPEAFSLWKSQYEPRSMQQCIGQQARKSLHRAPS